MHFLACASAVPEHCGPPIQEIFLPSGNSICLSTHDPDHEDHFFFDQMTEEMAQGKRLFDKGEWLRAAEQLRGVVCGETGDDKGNREKASVWMGVALASAGRWNEAQWIFQNAARQPGHALDHEAFRWLARAATGDCVTQRVLRTLAELPSHAQVLAEHEPTCFLRSPQLRYGRARGLFMIGKLDQAELEFEFVRGEPDYAAAATECLSAIAKRRGMP